MDYDDYLLNVKHLTDVEKAERLLQGHCDVCFGCSTDKTWCPKCLIIDIKWSPNNYGSWL